MFIGFSIDYKGVVCYDKVTGKVVVSRHVIHDEGILSFKEAAKFEFRNVSMSARHV